MDDVRTLEVPPDLAQLAPVRRFAATAADDLGAEVDRSDLALVIGELVANAILHGQAPVRLEISSTADHGLAISVHDGGAELPQVIRGAPWDATGHRGMVLVDALTTGWGVELEPGGKRVWAQLAPAGVSPRSGARPG